LEDPQSMSKIGTFNPFESSEKQKHLSFRSDQFSTNLI